MASFELGMGDKMAHFIILSGSTRFCLLAYSLPREKRKKHNIFSAG
jgi:hypothetical protein